MFPNVGRKFWPVSVVHKLVYGRRRAVCKRTVKIAKKFYQDKVTVRAGGEVGRGTPI